jgi:O-antigen/teichoic acid export membrane protein
VSLKQQASESVFWSAVERLSAQGIQFLLSLVIARILLPSDYGLIAMLSIFLAVSQIFVDSGFANALIQRRDRTETDYATVFYFNIALSAVVYLLLYLFAPAIADFYEQPQLAGITRIAGLVLIVNAFGIVQQAKLTIALDFKRQAQATLAAVTLSGALGVAMACAGCGVWALVFQNLLNNLVRVVLLNVCSRWKPRGRFSMESFRVLFSFGSKLLLSSLLHTLYTNLYTLIIGKRFAETELGFFNRSYTLAQFPSTNFTNIIVRAVYPIQSRLQDDDEKLNDVFFKYLRMACFLIFPVMVAFCVLAEPLVSLVLTDKWLPAVPFLQILCIAFMWDPVMKINHNMLNVKGRSDYFLQAEVWKKIVGFAILFASIPFGIKAMCVGLVLYSFVDIVIISRYLNRITGITLLSQVQVLIPVVLLAFSMGAVICLCRLAFSGLWLQLLSGAVAGVVYYTGMACLFRFQEINTLLSVAKNMKRKKA